jgi:hypothetical protein
MRFALVVGLLIGFAIACGKKEAAPATAGLYASCTDWADANLSGAQLTFCKGNNSKTLGQCCTANAQCQSGNCCPYGSASCGTGSGTVESCECY